METRESIIARIEAKLPFGAAPGGTVREESSLADLGIDSLHLLTMLLALGRDYSLDIEHLTRDGMPKTMGDLVTLIEQGRAMAENRIAGQ